MDDSFSTFDEAIAKLPKTLGAFERSIETRDAMQARLDAAKQALRSLGDVSDKEIERAHLDVLALPTRVATACERVKELLLGLKKDLRKADDEFSFQCRITSEITLARAVKHNLRFFGGDADEARSTLRGTVPGTRYQDRLWKVGERAVLNADERAIVVFVKSFLDHVAKHRASLIPLESATEKEKQHVATTVQP
jgi:hypothetical protein